MLSICVKESWTGKHREVLRIYFDHLRMHFEPIDVFRRGRIVDDFVGDFERQPGEEVEEYAPRRDAMPTAVPQARALRGSVPLRRKQSGAYPAQVGEAQDEGNEEVLF